MHTNGPAGLPLASACGAQHPLAHSVVLLQRHVWPATTPFGRHAAPPATSCVQQPFAAGHWLLVVQDCAHVFVPVPSSTHAAPVAQQLPPQDGRPSGQPVPASVATHWHAPKPAPALSHVCDPVAPVGHTQACVVPGVHDCAVPLLPLEQPVEAPAANAHTTITTALVLIAYLRRRGAGSRKQLTYYLSCFRRHNWRVLRGVPDADKTIKNVGKRVAELRETAGLTQDQLAEQVEMDAQNLRSIEAGRRNLTIRTMCRLATALKCSMPDLFLPTKRPKRGPGRPRKRTEGA